MLYRSMNIAKPIVNKLYFSTVTICTKTTYNYTIQKHGYSVTYVRHLTKKGGDLKND